LIIQRLLKAAIKGDSWSYSKGELEALAIHCTEEEVAADKVERLVDKSAAARSVKTWFYRRLGD